MARARPYRSPRRESAAARTRSSILLAARDLLRDSAATPTVGAIAARAGVSRLSVYHHFGSHSGVLSAVAEGTAASTPAAGGGLHEFLAASVARWAADPPLFRRLPERPPATHELASRLAAEDRLRPGCSLKEAEDVIAVIASFATFDRLHQDGRRSSATVTEILMRMAGSILNPEA
ncbi:MAG TPA: helix-turn-helix domain-containing protein [Candidatus Dormibacteraeota bacterium]|nr:helix-turn-helix domain-containing protein [Candidatus Dormibacteraeota bacterium]